MTEREWLTAADPGTMLEFLEGASLTSPRKHLLFACACIRQRIGRERGRIPFDVQAAERLLINEPQPSVERVMMVLGRLSRMAAATSEIATAEQLRDQCKMLRCIYRDPFASPTATGISVAEDVAALAEECYQDELLPDLISPLRIATLRESLADRPLPPDVLGHLQEEWHVRGCWVIESLLGNG